MSTTLLLLIYFGQGYAAVSDLFDSGKARAAPSWNPDVLDRTTRSPSLTRFGQVTRLTPPPLPPTPAFPPIDPDEEFQGGGNLIIDRTEAVDLLTKPPMNSPTRPPPSIQEVDNEEPANSHGDEDLRIPSVLVVIDEDSLTTTTTPRPIRIFERPILNISRPVITSIDDLPDPAPVAVVPEITTTTPAPTTTTTYPRRKSFGQFRSPKHVQHFSTSSTSTRVSPPLQYSPLHFHRVPRQRYHYIYPGDIVRYTHYSVGPRRILLNFEPVYQSRAQPRRWVKYAPQRQRIYHQQRPARSRRVGQQRFSNVYGRR